jgi:D-3-phosphoglycerate dehydrogenase / 2-oxoglutarate reductase
MKIVISDCDHESMSVEEELFAQSGLRYTHLTCRTEDEVIDQCRGAGIVMNQYAPFTRRVFAALRSDQKLIVRYGVGVDNIDLEAATQHGDRALRARHRTADLRLAHHRRRHAAQYRHHLLHLS